MLSLTKKIVDELFESDSLDYVIYNTINNESPAVTNYEIKVNDKTINDDETEKFKYLDIVIKKMFKTKFLEFHKQTKTKFYKTYQSYISDLGMIDILANFDMDLKKLYLSINLTKNIYVIKTKNYEYKTYDYFYEFSLNDLAIMFVNEIMKW